jgi:hypothetical protein
VGAVVEVGSGNACVGVASRGGSVGFTTTLVGVEAEQATSMAESRRILKRMGRFLKMEAWEWAGHGPASVLKTYAVGDAPASAGRL